MISSHSCGCVVTFKCLPAALAELACNKIMYSTMQLMLAIAAKQAKPVISFRSNCCLLQADTGSAAGLTKQRQDA